MKRYEVRGYVGGKVVHEHVARAEGALGRPLRGTEMVHHADGNSFDNDNSNLVICPNQAYHKLLHIRLNAFRASGDPNKRKCVLCHTHDDLANLAVHSRKGDMSYIHVACRREKDNRRYRDSR